MYSQKSHDLRDCSRFIPKNGYSHGHNGGNGPAASKTVNATSDLAVVVSASAGAFGTHTLSSVNADVFSADRGLASFAAGTVKATAIALGGAAYASANSLVDIFGADRGWISSTESRSADGSFASVTTSFLAADFNFGNQRPPTISESYDWDEISGTEGTISGNLAEYSADFLAAGKGSSVDLAIDAIAVEDSFSSTTISGTAAVSGSTTYTVRYGTSCSERISGTAENDLIYGGRGNDRISGKDGDDWLFGEKGNDRISGGSGDDTLLGGDGQDRMCGGSGEDWLLGGEDDDVLCGGSGNDLLLGGRGSDLLCGGSGDDLLSGDAGCDVLYGQAGNDVFRLGLPCGDGDDLYFGGSGGDRYLLVNNFDDDVIRDFSLANGDRLQVDPDAGWTITLRLGGCDRDDLYVLVCNHGVESTLLLEDFFSINSSLPMAQDGKLTLSEADALSQLLFAPIDDQLSLAVFGWGDALASVA